MEMRSITVNIFIFGPSLGKARLLDVESTLAVTSVEFC